MTYLNESQIGIVIVDRLGTSLLAKLLSGDIRVKDAEKTVGDVV